MPLETEAKARIRAMVADLRPNNGDLLRGLHRIQHELGWIPREAMQVLAEQLKLFPAEVYGATTFYSEFRLEPPPAVTVRWCSGPACRLRNSNGIRDAMLAVLGIDMDEQTEDNRVGVMTGQCNGTCELAPMVWLEDHLNHRSRTVGNLNAAQAVRMTRALARGMNPDEVTRNVLEGVISAPSPTNVGPEARQIAPDASGGASTAMPDTGPH